MGTSSALDQHPTPAQSYYDLETARLIDDLHEAGCQLLALGLPVIPVNGKRPCNRSGNPAPSWQTAKCDGSRIRRGLKGAADPKPNFRSGITPASEPGIGLRMGPGSVIDIETDSPDEREAVNHLFRGCRQPATVSYESKRGRHDLYRWDDRFAQIGQDVFEYHTPEGRSVQIRLGAGPKCGAQSVIPPTPGRHYIPGRSFADLAPASLPETVIERLLDQSQENHRGKQQTTLRNRDENVLGNGDEDSELNRLVEVTEGTSQNDESKPNSTHLALPQTREIVLGVSYESLRTPAIESAIANAVSASIPTMFQTRHKCTFELVRRLRAIPELQAITRNWLETEDGQRWLHPILSEWYRRGKQYFRADFDECVFDLIEGWDKVKVPYGGALKLRHQESLSERLPSAVISRLGDYDCENNRALLQLCAVLQRAAGDKPFALDGRSCADVLGNDFSQTSVARKLRLFVMLGFLDRTFAGTRKRAAEYRYLPAVAGQSVGDGAEPWQSRQPLQAVSPAGSR